MSSRRISPAKVRGIVPAAAAVSVASLTAGHPAIAEVIGGLLILLAAVLIGARLTTRAAFEADTTQHLVLEALLVLAVLMALAGIAVMGLAIPIPR